MHFKAKIMDEQAIRRALTRISFEIIEHQPDLSNAVLVGIKTRGIPIAKVIRKNIANSTGVELPMYQLDVSYYRDDVDHDKREGAKFKGDIEGKDVILVDDVLFTGRTTRAAIEAILDAGRASSIKLAVLVDRGHRELPVKADFVGKNVPTSMREEVVVSVGPLDGETGVSIYEKE